MYITILPFTLTFIYYDSSMYVPFVEFTSFFHVDIKQLRAPLIELCLELKYEKKWQTQHACQCNFDKRYKSVYLTNTCLSSFGLVHMKQETVRKYVSKIILRKRLKIITYTTLRVFVNFSAETISTWANMFYGKAGSKKGRYVPWFHSGTSWIRGGCRR